MLKASDVGTFNEHTPCSKVAIASNAIRMLLCLYPGILYEHKPLINAAVSAVDAVRQKSPGLRIWGLVTFCIACRLTNAVLSTAKALSKTRAVSKHSVRSMAHLSADTAGPGVITRMWKNVTQVQHACLCICCHLLVTMRLPFVTGNEAFRNFDIRQWYIRIRVSCSIMY